MMVICETCLKAAICRHKCYHMLMSQCNELRYHLYYDGHLDAYMRRDSFSEDIQRVEMHLKPKDWRTIVVVDFIKITSK